MIKILEMVSVKKMVNRLSEFSPLKWSAPLRAFAVTLMCAVTLSLAPKAMAQDFEQPVSWSASQSAVGDGIYEIKLTASMEEGWHIYDLGPYDGGPTPTSLKVSGDGVELVGTPYIVGDVHKAYDEIFSMDIGTCSNGVAFAQKVKVLSASAVSVTANIEWQACNDGSCMPPMDEDFTLQLPGAADASVADNGKEKSIWAVILEAIAWGFVALLTPCVFPMVPMTVSFFLKNSGGKARGRFMASLYGFSIVALYTIPIAVIIFITYFIGGDAVTADIFNWLATHWIPNIIFFAIFMVFAASFFGAFEITMPSWMVNKADAKSDKGGIIGVFFMALTLVLVSFSCTGPIVGSILIKSTQGEIWEPIITMVAFSAAFALPFTVFAFAPSLLKELPKSGGWLNSVKVVLGFLELALGLKFLSVADQTYHWGILDREVYLALWIVIFSLLGMYLLGKIRFAHDTPQEHLSVKRLILSIIVFAFVVYMIPGMWGAPLKALSGYLPPITTQDFVVGQGVPAAAQVEADDNEALPKRKYADFLHLPHGLDGFFEYNEALAYAKSVNKPLFVDFTGHGCVNCREMEARVWSDPRVIKLLRENYVIVALYADDKKTLDKSEWVTLENGKVLKELGKINSNFVMNKFGANAQPYYLLLDGAEEKLAEPRGYNLDPDAFVAFLEEGIKNYNK